MRKLKSGVLYEYVRNKVNMTTIREDLLDKSEERDRPEVGGQKLGIRERTH